MPLTKSRYRFPLASNRNTPSPRTISPGARLYVASTFASAAALVALGVSADTVSTGSSPNAGDDVASDEGGVLSVESEKSEAGAAIAVLRIRECRRDAALS